MENEEILAKANAVMSNMEMAYGRKMARRMVKNTLDALVRYDDKTDTRPFIEQFLGQLVGTFENCEKIQRGR